MDDLDKGLRIGTFDIESTALEAQHGYMLCACIKEVNKENLDGKTYTFRIDDYDSPYNDKPLVRDVIKCLNSFDVIINWYGSRFDFPFVNTRALKHGLRPPVRNYRRDLCLCARGFGKLRDNKLVTWDKFLFGKTEKTFLDWSTWIDAIRGNKKAIDYITTHCQKDVLVTERIYKKVMPCLGKLRKN